MNKRGQFYLLAAIIIIGLIGGLLLVSNYSKKTNDIRVYELGEELKVEIGKAMDYWIINNNFKTDDFTSNFSNYAGKDIEIIYIIGNTSIIDVYNYNKTEQKENVNYIKSGDSIYVVAAGTNHSFELRPGENFYFIMSQEIKGERYVVTN
jgi:hypothetical protein